MNEREEKFTPGPWFASGQLIFAESKKCPIAAVNGLWLLTGNTFEANAALIAAAPELYANEEANLEVLKNLTVVYEEMENLVATDADVQNVLGPQVTTDVVHGIVIRLRQRIEATEKILAKARGEVAK